MRATWGGTSEEEDDSHKKLKWLLWLEVNLNHNLRLHLNLRKRYAVLPNPNLRNYYSLYLMTLKK